VEQPGFFKESSATTENPQKSKGMWVKKNLNYELKALWRVDDNASFTPAQYNDCFCTLVVVSFYDDCS
jgi:hypothetical protein